MKKPKKAIGTKIVMVKAKCPYCKKWTNVIALEEERKKILCHRCGKKFGID